MDGDIIEEGRRLMREAAARGFPLRLLGGVALWMRSSDEAHTLFGRRYPDLDFVCHKKQSRQLRRLLEELDYSPQRTFNAAHGAKRLLYHAPDGFQVDVFLDVFEMCHRLDLGERLEVEDLTLPAADLLLTKLQVVEINRKDLTDVLMLLYDHELADGDGPRRLNAARVASLCGADWGLFTTISDNLVKLRDVVPEVVSDQAAAVRLQSNVDGLSQRLEEAPKTLSWRLRAQVGRRRRWYELPEEVVR
jgi:Uncharacterised nucleotidyltransferase